MTTVGACKECGRSVSATETAVYPVQGYEVTRGGGGQNHVLHKTRVDGYVWHKPCFDVVMMRKQGGAAFQGSLLA
jgi:hypothetical protein